MNGRSRIVKLGSHLFAGRFCGRRVVTGHGSPHPVHRARAPRPAAFLPVGSAPWWWGDGGRTAAVVPAGRGPASMPGAWSLVASRARPRSARWRSTRGGAAPGDAGRSICPAAQFPTASTPSGSRFSAGPGRFYSGVRSAQSGLGVRRVAAGGDSGRPRNPHSATKPPTTRLDPLAARFRPPPGLSAAGDPPRTVTRRPVSASVGGSPRSERPRHSLSRPDPRPIPRPAARLGGGGAVRRPAQVLIQSRSALTGGSLPISSAPNRPPRRPPARRRAAPASTAARATAQGSRTPAPRPPAQFPPVPLSARTLSRVPLHRIRGAEKSGKRDPPACQDSVDLRAMGQ